MYVLAVLGVVADGSVPTDELHASFLALSGIEEDAVVVPPIPVAVLLSALPSEQEYEGPIPRRRDATLPLTSIRFMDLRSSVVDSADLEHGWYSYSCLHHKWPRMQASSVAHRSR